MIVLQYSNLLSLKRSTEDLTSSTKFIYLLTLLSFLWWNQLPADWQSLRMIIRFIPSWNNSFYTFLNCHWNRFPHGETLCHLDGTVSNSFVLNHNDIRRVISHNITYDADLVRCLLEASTFIIIHTSGGGLQQSSDWPILLVFIWIPVLPSWQYVINRYNIITTDILTMI